MSWFASSDAKPIQTPTKLKPKPKPKTESKPIDPNSIKKSKTVKNLRQEVKASGHQISKNGVLFNKSQLMQILNDSTPK